MIILPEDKNIVSLLPAEDARQLLLALFSDDGDLPEMSTAARIAYVTIKGRNDRLETGKKAFRDRQSVKGKMGGAPLGNQNAKKQPETSQNNPEQTETSLPGTDTDTNTVTKSDIDTKTKETRTRARALPLAPPTLDEIRGYCRERGNNVDPQRFYDYFLAGGWVDGNGKPVKNWKQKVITWENHANNANPRDGPKQGAQRPCKEVAQHRYGQRQYEPGELDALFDNPPIP